VTGLAPATTYRVVAAAAGGSAETVITTPAATIGPDGVTIAVGSCFYGYFRQAGRYLRALRSPCRFSPPTLKLLVGDNLYLDVGPNEGRDAGYEQTVMRYLEHYWRSPYADALEYLPTLTTWDDHEFWNNYPESQAWLSRSWFDTPHRKEYMDAARECLEVFQNTLNPPPATGTAGHRSFVHDLPPLSFFFADVRSNRSLYQAADRARHEAGRVLREMLPEPELRAFERWCASLTGPGVLVIGQPLWIAGGGGTDYNPPAFADQYVRIWQAIAGAPHDVLILSGDVHFSRALRIELPGRTTYEFITSPACHIPTSASVAWNAIWGTEGAQGRGEVEVPRSFPLDKARSYTDLEPRLGRYLMGTDAQNTIALLHFTPSGGRIDVGAVMVDLETNDVARSRPADLPGWFSGSDAPAFPCYEPHLFTLR
jgi:hypothetical protein